MTFAITTGYSQGRACRRERPDVFGQPALSEALGAQEKCRRDAQAEHDAESPQYVRGRPDTLNDGMPVYGPLHSRDES